MSGLKGKGSWGGHDKKLLQEGKGRYKKKLKKREVLSAHQDARPSPEKLRRQAKRPKKVQNL